MRFLLDVNASGSLADWLKDLGHDVLEVRHRDPRMRDDDILNWAASEKRIIVTTDNDFEEIVWRQGKTHNGILRLENLPRAERKTLLFDTLDKHGKDLDSGAIVIASKIKFRVRKP